MSGVDIETCCLNMPSIDLPCTVGKVGQNLWKILKSNAENRYETSILRRQHCPCWKRPRTNDRKGTMSRSRMYDIGHWDDMLQGGMFCCWKQDENAQSYRSYNGEEMRQDASRAARCGWAAESFPRITKLDMGLKEVLSLERHDEHQDQRDQSSHACCSQRKLWLKNETDSFYFLQKMKKYDEQFEEIRAWVFIFISSPSEVRLHFLSCSAQSDRGRRSMAAHDMHSEVIKSQPRFSRSRVTLAHHSSSILEESRLSCLWPVCVNNSTYATFFYGCFITRGSQLLLFLSRFVAKS